MFIILQYLSRSRKLMRLYNFSQDLREGYCMYINKIEYVKPYSFYVSMWDTEIFKFSISILLL